MKGPTPELAIGIGTLAVAAALGAGAVQISSVAGYSGVGPNFLPWVVAVMLLGCGLLLVREARGGGFHDREPPSGAATGYWPGFAWVSAGLLVNAALITRAGFILSCALCFVLAARGFRSGEGKGGVGWRGLIDLGIGLAIAAPVFWLFTQLLAINLPGLTSTGWL